MNLETDDERDARWRKNWRRDPRVEKLEKSGALADVLGMLRDKRRLKPFESDHQTPLDVWIVQAVCASLAAPDVAETMTASERRRLAKTIIDSAGQLSQAIKPFESDAGMRWPFQPVLDRLALNVQISEEDRLREAGVPMDSDTAHRCRFAVYHLLMERLDWVFEALIEGAEWFAESETLLKNPNDKNADRLYFIRMLNRKFCLEFRAPCRAAVLALTSVYFDCSDLDEAALSKLAPFYKPTPVVVGEDRLEFMASYYAERGDPTYVERLKAHWEAESKWGMGRESSAESD